MSMSAASWQSIRSRCARVCRATSTACISMTARSSSRATSCSRSTSGRSRTRSTRRAPISTLARSNLTYHRGRPCARQAARARQDHRRAGVRAARAGQAQCRSVGAGERGGRAPGRARSAIHRIARAGGGPHRRPPGVAGQSHHRRHHRHHHDARHHRVAGSHPLRVHVRRGRLSALRAVFAHAAAKSPAARAASSSRSS